MSILKKLKRGPKQKQTSVKDVTKIVAMVNQLINMKLIRLGNQDCSVTMAPAVWEGKDAAFRNNWCKNILTAWFVMREREYSELQQLDVYFDDRPELLGVYSIKNGFDEKVIFGRTYSDIVGKP